MGIWQQAISALNRLFVKQNKLERIQSRAYAGAAINRLTSDWIASSTSADSELRSSLRTLRNRSRELCRNNDYAKGALRTITNNVVGKGIPLQSQVKKKRGDKLDEDINTAIEDLWLQWQSAKYCHVSGKLCFADIERLLMRSIIESGEVLVRLVRLPFAGSPIPLALEIIEADQLCDEYTSNTLSTPNQVRMGVEVDAWQRPVAYWLYPHHPGDYQFHFKTNELLRIPASQVLHLYICDRPGQTRGVPWFHTALMRMRHVGGFEEAELVAARAQAAVMGFIQTPDGGDLLGETYNERRVSSLEPGAIEVLGPGETFAGFAPTRPNQGFDPFIRMMLRAVASGIGMSYEALSSDYSNTSYSSARTALLDERDNYRIVQDWLIKNFHEPVFELWLELAVMTGALNLPLYELNPRFYQKPRWVPRGWQWVDPQNEVTAYKEAIKAGFTTTSQVVAQSGLDIEDVLKERRRELDLASDAKIAFDTTLEVKEEEKKESLLSQFGGASDSADRSVSGVPFILKRAKNCKKGKACGNSCISASKNCKKSLPAAAAAAAPTVAKNSPKKSTKKKGKAQLPTTTPTPSTPSSSVGYRPTMGGGVVSTNDKELTARRSELVTRFGQKAVEDAEKNLKKVIDKSDVFIRCGSSNTLEQILGSEFKTAYDLGTDIHQIPHLRDGYLAARRRVEAKVLGIEPNKNDLDRPIYGYLGDPKVKGASHGDVADAYGSIAIKLKSEIKDVSTFTGADSFKSGIASKLSEPNAASIVPFTRHGYDRDSLPAHYPSFYSDDSSDSTFLWSASKGRDVNALALNLSPTGNAYVEVQIQKRVTPDDIAEIHFNSKGSQDRPTKAIAQIAKDKGIDLYVDGKKVDLDNFIANSPDFDNFSNRTNHKPFMAQTDAIDYVKNSFYNDKTFYHGTGKVGADSITTTGVDISKNTVAVYGQGFYVGGTKSIAKSYAASHSGSEVLSIKLDIRKPAVFNNLIEMDDYLNKQGFKAKTINRSREITKFLKKQGYDGVEITNMEYFVAFDPKQVVVFDRKKV